MLDELQNACRPGMIGGFLPGVKQIANVAALPGIVHKSIGLPDVHSGYGFAIGLKLIFSYIYLLRNPICTIILNKIVFCTTVWFPLILSISYCNTILFYMSSIS